MQIKIVHSTQTTVHCLNLLVRLLFLAFTFYIILYKFNCYSQGVSVNTTGVQADYSSILDASSTSQGLLIPRMTTSDRNAIISPALSLLIFNTTTNCFEAYVNGIWYSVSCPPPCNIPSAPTAGISISFLNQIIWNWNSVTGVSGYKWSTSNNYSAAVDNSFNVSFTQSSLRCNTPYSLYVWAYNACGNSAPVTLTQATNVCTTICSQWQKNFGGASFGFECQQTSDGGFFVSGVAYGLGDIYGDFYLYKTDGSGNLTWSRTYGGNGTDNAYSAQQTSDGGYVMTGFTGSFGFGNDHQKFYLVKTDGSGNLSWSKTYGGSSLDIPLSVMQTSDNGYIMAGYSTSFGILINNIYVVKTDANGNLLWSKTFGGNSYDKSWSVYQINDGGYIIAGSTSSFGLYYTYCNLIRIDGSGNLLWSKAYKAPDSLNFGQTIGLSVRQTLDGGLIIAGGGAYQLNNGWLEKCLLIKTDVDGNVAWSKAYGGSYVESFITVKQTFDGGYIMGGQSLLSFDPGSHWDYYLLKTDGNGKVSWGNVYSGPPNDSQGWSVGQTSDGGYVMTGLINLNLDPLTSSYFSYVVKTDPYGNAAGCYTHSAANTAVTDITLSVIDLTSQTQVKSPSTSVIDQTSATIVGTQTPAVNTLCKKCN
jgi:hypothetical protein